LHRARDDLSPDGITWLGHSTVLIEAENTRLLTDPVLRSRVAHLRRIVPPPSDPKLEQLDAVLISHAHRDHLDLPSLDRLPSSCPLFAPRHRVSMLRRRRLNARPLRVGERVQVNELAVLATQARHRGRRHPFSGAGETLAYLVEGRASVYFAGDTDVFEEMSELAGRITVALLPIWGWGARIGPGHMDPERAARAAALLEPIVAVPIHWGTFASPRASWVADPNAPVRAFTRHARRLAPQVAVEVLAPGGRIDL
jgi:L-ascorbate metabolism protein UlaG (beta-lactamase superfamily)